ncbi:MAG: hypothetical protein A2V88_04350 [Elusimicrobia bacterium RBG_16_66_12]|nr:MAG: hypothetical protein A2V88_04350 [Elusimicrobia bacterium RBG_16_66_12]
MTTATDTITIHLSDRAPVRIADGAWPCIALASWHDGQIACQANKVAYVRARRHEDGRIIVYGALKSGPGGCYAGWRDSRAGYLLGRTGEETPTDEIVRAIRRVAGAIGMTELGDECIGDLPPVDLE